MRLGKPSVKNFLGGKRDHLSKITLDNIEQMMIHHECDKGFIEEILAVFEKRIEMYGEKEFQHWFHHLCFKVPEEFQNEKESVRIYRKYSSWMEREVRKLESETGLSWEEQTADIMYFNAKARKAQLVIRHRLSEIALDLLDK
ncbi:hypothetical protein GXN76_15220 [Kroppenstedtia pulmonis]|uniref:Uncharacterized protein n=1 Tax=Kroppenstedtia pulmonis TaxID=1380685 RepID=A0A7D3XK45_9BACL|nr:hypothetical protein [Kroppenstedtia pulmonis]QKG85664.1 hypothetical protein GXN76_15220 [Kroppenstedtia pulmonis]